MSRGLRFGGKSTSIVQVLTLNARMKSEPFHNPYSHGFVRAAVCIPWVRVADPAYNAERTS